MSGPGITTTVRSPLMIAVAVAAAAFALATGAAGTVGGANGRIAFASTSGTIYLSTEDGRSTVALGEGGAPAWSPDGRRLVVFRRTPGPCAPCNYALDVIDVASQRRTAIFEGTTFDPAPAWSPDGRRIAFVNQRATGDDEIWTIAADGSDPRQVTNTLDNFAPAWSPDGGRIAFYGFGRDGIHIYSIRADGGDLRQLTFGAGVDTRPTWSPDGSRMAFLSSRGGSFEVYSMNADGSDVRALAPGSGPRPCPGPCPFPYANPSWSPDGSKILFASDRNGAWRLYTVPATGGAATRLPIEVDALDPDWQPSVDLEVAPISPRQARVGRTVTLRLTVRNVASRGARNVRMTVSVDRRRLVVVRTPPSVGDLAAGQAATVDVTVRARRPGRALVRATVASTEADASPENNTASPIVVIRRR